MKKLLASLLVLSMVVALAGCTKTVTRSSVSYDSLEEINEIIGCNLITPDFDEISDEKFNILDEKIAEYIFTSDGITYTFRAGQLTEEDISDVYSGSKLLADSVDENGYASDKNGKILRWYISEDDITTQYTFYAADKGQLDEDYFMSLIDELQDGTVGVTDDTEFGKQLYPYIAGEYTDATSQVATLTIENNEDHVTITVIWPQSDKEYTEWKMTATFSSTWGLPYSDCVKKNVTLKSNGEIDKEEIVTENVSGYFGIDGQCNLYWYGATEEECKSCIFKINK